MRSVSLALLVALGAALPASAQIGIPSIGGAALDSTLLRFNPVSRLAAGLGFTTIDGGEEQGEFLLLQLQPEFDLGAIGAPQLGLGIDAPLRFQLAGGDSTRSALSFRGEDYDDTNEILAVLRYVRYGQKDGGQALYARFGALDFARIGYGSLVESYRNEVGEDARQRGGALDLDLGGVGFESMYGTFAEAGVYAARGFVRPLRVTGGEAGGWNDLTVGVTVAGDLNPEAGFVNAAAPGQPFFLGRGPDGAPVATGATADRGRLRALGLDLGMRLATHPLFQASVYANGNHLTDGAGRAGSGGGLGLLVSLTPPDATASRLDLRLEAVLNGAGYQPSLFNAFYEVDRLIAVDSVVVGAAPGTGAPTYATRYQSRRNVMEAQPRQGGMIGQLSGVVAGVLLVSGRYQQLFDAGSTGWLHLGADLLVPGGRAFARVGLDRWNIGGDATTNTDLQGRDFQLQAQAGVQLLPTLLLGVNAQRAFSPVYASGEVVDYLRQDRVEPVVQFVLPF